MTVPHPAPDSSTVDKRACMVARSDHLAGLKASDSSTCLQALREVRNQVIGSKQKKSQYLQHGVLQQVLALLGSSKNSEVLVQCAAVVGSLAYQHDDAVRDIVAHDGIAVLLRCLSHEEAGVVQAAARTLKLVYQSGCAPHEPLLRSGELQRLVALLSDPNQQLAAVAAAVLERCSCSSAEAKQLCAAGAVPGLLDLLGSTDPAAQAHAITTLAALAAHSPAACQQLLEAPSAVTCLGSLARHPSSSALRLQAAAAVAALVAAAHSGALEVAAPLLQTLQCISRGLLPGLIKLLQVPEYRDQVPALLATLLSCQPSLLPLLLETDTLKQLLGMLQANHNNNNNSSSSSSASPQLRASCLRALGSFALASGEARRQLVDSKAWPTAVAALSEEGSAQVQAGGVLLVHALSRSVAQLRAQGMEADVAAPLCRMLAADDEAVQVHASAALCNLVLEFSNVREALLRCGALGQLVPLAASMLPEVRLNAVWALKNLTFEAEDGLRSQVMEQLGWGGLQALLEDGEGGVRAQAMALLQNLCKGGPAALQGVMAWSGGQLLPVLQQQLEAGMEVGQAAAAEGGAAGAAPSSQRELAGAAATGGGSVKPTRTSPSSSSSGGSRDVSGPSFRQARLAALYTVANICAGPADVKAAVMASQLPALMVRELQRAAGVGCSSNGAGGGSSGGEPEEGPSTSGRGSGNSSGGGNGGSPAAAGAAGGSGRVRLVRAGSRLGSGQQLQQGGRGGAGGGGAGSSSGGAASGSRQGAAGGEVRGVEDYAVLELCVPVVWCIINLLWREESGGSSSGRGTVAAAAAAEGGGSQGQALPSTSGSGEAPSQQQEWEQQLRGLGVVEALRGLREAGHQDLKERVAVALEQLEGSSGQ